MVHSIHIVQPNPNFPGADITCACGEFIFNGNMNMALSMASLHLLEVIANAAYNVPRDGKDTTQGVHSAGTTDGA